MVYENDQYISTNTGNGYHYVWLTSCDGVNYFYNNENGWSWRMKAFKDANGTISSFKFDTDMTYYDGTIANMFSNVTYNTDGSIATIGGAGGDTLVAKWAFTKNVTNYSATQCGTIDYGSYPYTRYFNTFNNTRRRNLEI